MRPLPLIEQGNGKLECHAGVPLFFFTLPVASQRQLRDQRGGARRSQLFTCHDNPLPGTGQGEALLEYARF
jgi:hypothetical protein